MPSSQPSLGAWVGFLSFFLCPQRRRHKRGKARLGSGLPPLPGCPACTPLLCASARLVPAQGTNQPMPHAHALLCPRELTPAWQHNAAQHATSLLKSGFRSPPTARLHAKGMYDKGSVSTTRRPAPPAPQSPMRASDCAFARAAASDLITCGGLPPRTKRGGASAIGLSSSDVAAFTLPAAHAGDKGSPRCIVGGADPVGEQGSSRGAGGGGGGASVKQLASDAAVAAALPTAVRRGSCGRAE